MLGQISSTCFLRHQASLVKCFKASRWGKESVRAAKSTNLGFMRENATASQSQQARHGSFFYAPIGCGCQSQQGMTAPRPSIFSQSQQVTGATSSSSS
eukprot:4243288-Amphidinium_carterae.1